MSDPGALDDAVARMCDGDGFRKLYRAGAADPPALPRGARRADRRRGRRLRDLAQARRDLGRFRGGGDGFLAWITTIGRHRALDLLRQRSRRPRVVTDLTDLAPADAVDLEVRIEVALGTCYALALLRELPPGSGRGADAPGGGGLGRHVRGRGARQATRRRTLRGPARAVQPGQAAGRSHERVWRRRDIFSPRGAEGSR
ncbi:MAG: hypothetical protein WAV00_24570 [Nocardioides sp.]